MNDLIQLIAEKILSKQCVLFLGPGIFKEDPEYSDSIYEKFAMDLGNEMKQGNFIFDETQKRNIYYMIPRYRVFRNSGNIQRVNIADMRTKFSDYAIPQIASNSLLASLAELPFRIVVNGNPDKEIKRHSPNARNTVFSFYDISNHAAEDTRGLHVLTKSDFSANSKVVYNLFGSFDNPNSLLLTEDELLEYNVHLNQDNTRIPKTLTNELDSNKYYLFLGFQFDHWLLKIVLKSLGLPKGIGITYTISSIAAPVFQRHFYEDQFRFSFVDDPNSELFVKQLTEEFKKLKSSKTVTSVSGRKLKLVFLFHCKNKGDCEAQKQLGYHIKPFRDSGKIWIWSEEFLDPDEEIDVGIAENLIDADIILPLVSSEMIGERDIQLKLLKRIYEDREKKPVIRPILLRAYDHLSIPFLNEFPWLPMDDRGEVRAIENWHNDQEAYKIVTQGLAVLI